MLTVLQLIALFLVAITMTCSLGHALELPGKLRLPKETYLAVQPIYYPGFTLVGGFAEGRRGGHAYRASIRDAARQRGLRVVAFSVRRARASRSNLLDLHSTGEQGLAERSESRRCRQCIVSPG